MLDLRNTLSTSSIISEDINVHLDVTTSALVRKINCLLKRHSIYQTAIVPSHTSDQILYIVMSRPPDDIVCSITVSQLILSDHYCVVCHLSAIKPVNHAERKQARSLRGIDLKTFKADLCQLMSPTV